MLSIVINYLTLLLSLLGVLVFCNLLNVSVLNNYIMKKVYFLVFAIVSVMGLIAISGCDKKETYTVTFDANGGTGTMVSQTFTEGEQQPLTKNAFAREGYTFAGWNTIQAGTGTSYRDEEAITVVSDMTLYAQWTENAASGGDPSAPLGGHAYVDLGLPSGTLWATCNVGADTPEGNGNYYAWGETATKEVYDNANYTYSDSPATLPASADAAAAIWGNGWRMPTKDEFVELFSNCTNEWTAQNGVVGRLFTATNGNSLFLPASGARLDDILDGIGEYGYYWSSSLDSDHTEAAWALTSITDDCGASSVERYFGMSVRPVCKLVK